MRPTLLLPLVADCTCVAPPMLRIGALVCGSCGATIRAKVEPRFAEVYGSRSPYLPLPGYSYATTRKLAPTIAGAKRTGGKRGRDVFWLISHAAFVAWRDRKSTRVVEPVREESPDNVVDLDDWFRTTGHRPTTGSQR